MGAEKASRDGPFAGAAWAATRKNRGTRDGTACRIIRCRLALG